MNEALQFLVRYGALVLFANVFIEGIGLPIPAVPMMLAAGALAGTGRMNLAVALAAATIASLGSDFIWYYLGRTRGNRVMGLLCRISLEPDTCVRRTSDIFARFGMRAIVAGKFLPGLGLVIPPMAGVFKVTPRRFLAFDGLGSLLYTGCFLGIGFAFSNQLQRVIDAVTRLGVDALWLVGGLLLVYIAFRFARQKLIMRQLRMARITVDELRRKQEAGEQIIIVDLRSPLDVQNDPFGIVGAWGLHVHELESWQGKIPRDREVVVYCSCPNEVTAVRIAMALRKKGITRIRPLLGGLEAWRERNYPVVAHRHVTAEMIAGTA